MDEKVRYKRITNKKKISDLQENSENILKKSKIILDNYSINKINESKINEFDSFQNKVNDMLIAHEIRINNNVKEINNISSKYDKIISENIYIPGFIGPSCHYKTLSEYINNNIDEINKIKIEKETLKKEQKDYKAKIESFMKQMILLNETSMAQNREYTNSKQKDYELLLDGKLQPLNEKIFRFYESSFQFQSNIEKNIKLFRNDLDKVLQIKEELINIINEKELNLKKKLDDLYKKIVLNIQDIGINKNKISGIKNEIDGIKKTHDKLKTSVIEINKEIKILKNNNMPKNNIIKGRRQSMSNLNFDGFKNNLYLNNVSPRRINKHKTIIYNKTENIKEEINKKFKKEAKEKDIKNKTIDNAIQKDENSESNEENSKINDNQIKDDNKIELINKLKLENKENQISKNKYKKIYNKIFDEKDKEKDGIFDTFYLGKTKIPIITKPIFLEQRILSDEEMRKLYKGRNKNTKEKEKIEKIRKSFFNFDLSSKNKNTNDNIDINNKGKNFNINYKLSTPKLNTNQKKENNKNNLTNYDKKRIQTKNMVSPKLSMNKKKLLNLINLKLDNSVSINPDTNNGAYVLAKKQFEHNNKTRLNLTPTSYIYLINDSKEIKTPKLVSMTFMKENRKISNSFINTLENEES